MSDTTQPQPPEMPESGSEATRAPFGQDRTPLATWKKVVFALAALVAISGLTLKAMSGGSGSGGGKGTEVAEGGGTPIDGSGASSSFLGQDSFPGIPGLGGTKPEGEAGGTTVGSDGETSFSEEWSPTMVKLGFSLVVGMALGVFLRSFLKVTLGVLGLILLVQFGLEYAGWAEIQWDTISANFDNFWSKLGDEFSSFKEFIQGRLPSSGALATGFYAGVKRN